MGTNMTEGEGERLEQARRRKFWSMLGLIALVGAATGFIFGFATGYEGVALAEVPGILPDWLVIGLVVLAATAFTYLCWRFKASIDEVELADNLWASTASYYLYGILFPAWWVLGAAGITPEPSGWTIYLVALVGGLLVYGWRKWRAR